MENRSIAHITILYTLSSALSLPPACRRDTMPYSWKALLDHFGSKRIERKRLSQIH
jgi:hypothetical protein